jgi:hypothetical protein
MEEATSTLRPRATRAGALATGLVPALAIALGAACSSGSGQDPRPPVAAITAPSETRRIAAGESVEFSGSCVDENGGAVLHAWTFAGGSPAASALPSPGAVAFEAAGTFEASYVCADERGLASNVATRSIVVSEPYVLQEHETRYDIELVFLTDVTAAQHLAFTRARERIELAVTGDLPDLPLNLPPIPSCGNVPISGTVDDLLILVRIVPIDGRGGIVGAAGPCVVRSGSKLPALGIIELDADDVRWLERNGRLESVVLHEMIHVLGFGTIWNSLSLLSGAGTSDPCFVGADARSAFLESDGGASYAGTPVPVEGTGGVGVADAHWRETVFGDELMTGWLSGGAQPLSRTTLMSLADMGYEIDPSRADPVEIAALRLFGTDPGSDVFLGEDVRAGPVYEVDARGDVVGTR